MKFDRQSNIYIIVYTTLLVVIVGTALAFTSNALRPRQQANVDADKMRQILASLRLTASDESVGEQFNRIITEQFVVDSHGDRIEGRDAFRVDLAAETRLPADQRALPVYKAILKPGDIKYVIPVYGSGLWGPIWGYIAVDSDGSTIYGAYFSHQGETPGLGAEIAKPIFSNRFAGKTLFKNNRFIPVEVIKNGGRPADADADIVDAIAGATITSKGVGAMLDDSLRPYSAFLKQLK